MQKFNKNVQIYKRISMKSCKISLEILKSDQNLEISIEILSKNRRFQNLVSDFAWLLTPRLFHQYITVLTFVSEFFSFWPVVCIVSWPDYTQPAGALSHRPILQAINAMHEYRVETRFCECYPIPIVSGLAFPG